MLLSLGIIFIFGLMIDKVFKKINIPSLIGYLFLGILLGPEMFKVLDEYLLIISTEMRQVVLIVILTRAGLSLNFDDLKKVGLPAFLLSFLPATFEILAVIVFAPKLLGLSIIDAALLGTILSAVSPAVVAPRMINFIKHKKGTDKGIPQLILAGASVDDIYALVLFTSFLSISLGETFKMTHLLQIPVSIISGVAVGILFGIFLNKLFKSTKTSSFNQMLILLSVSFILVSIENIFTFSGILAVMSMAFMININNPQNAQKLQHIYNKLWIPGEILLFVLVGSSVNISYAFSQGLIPIILILIALVIRMFGVWISVLPTKLSFKEKLFVMVSYTPKATVQAAIGSIPLSMGLESGALILTVSVLAILITAPLGAIGIDLSADTLI